jgi:hypothetical protein
MGLSSTIVHCAWANTLEVHEVNAEVLSSCHGSLKGLQWFCLWLVSVADTPTSLWPGLPYGSAYADSLSVMFTGMPSKHRKRNRQPLHNTWLQAWVDGKQEQSPGWHYTSQTQAPHCGGTVPQHMLLSSCRPTSANVQRLWW